jgi:Dolichyl-phosphate-mannose-protein mannosyltransferase
MHPRTRLVLLAAVVVIVAAALALWRLDVESIWHDEAWSIRAIRSPFGTPDDNTPPLYYVTLHLLHELGVGESPFALRYGSVLIFLLTVSLGFRIGHRWYGLTAGTLAGLLLAMSPLLWEYAQEVRAYIAVPCFALMLLALADRFLDGRPIPRRLWVFTFITELALLYTHNLSVPLIVWVNGIVLSGLGWQFFTSPPTPLQVERGASFDKSSPSPLRRGGQGVRSKIISWMGMQVILFLLYMPWLTSQSPSGTRLNTVPVFGSKLSQDLWRGYILPIVTNPDDLPDKMIWVSHLLPLLVAISLIMLAWRGRSRRTLLILSQVVLLPIFSTLLLQRASIDFHPRYYILAIPTTLLLLVAAMAALPKSIQLGGAIIVIGVMAYISYQSLSLIADNRQYQHDDFRGMAEYYATLPDDALIIIPYDDEPTFTNYYFDKLGIKADLLLMPLYSSEDEAIRRINEALEGRDETHVELLTWFQVPADERGMYGCLLGGISEEVSGTFETYGLSTTAYDLSQPVSVTEIPVTNLFDSALHLEHISHNETCLQVAWELSGTPQSEEYNAAARILNPLGWEITADDGLILRDDQARLRAWDHGDIGESFLLLPLPDGTPTQNYEILLRQYTADHPSGFDLLENGAPIGKDLRFEISLAGNPFEKIPDEPSLSRDNTVNGEIYSGQHLELEIVNPYSEEVTLTLVGEEWTLEQTIPAGEPSLWWGAFQIPADAQGQARLLLENIELATYRIILTDRLFDLPDVQYPLEAQLGEVAVLSGATLKQNDDTIEVELVWQSMGTPSMDYKVFVQLLDANGQFLTGSDAEPASGERPTSTWIPDEYIKDSHALKVDGLNYTGIGTIIAGLYDPITGERLHLPDGSDFVRLPVEMMLGD